ncbi:MAG: hypothetical protein K940chlam9_01048 [Chlamydiae bacterium]|nr:hypothetical protein [Chlamydiota bacterium]
MLFIKADQGRILKVGYLFSYLLNAPLFAIYSLMAFILYKDLHASPIQITTLVAIKPMVAVISSYWNEHFSLHRGRMRANIIGATLIGLLPTFFYPFFQNAWLFVGAFGIYFFAERAVIPAWMELIKISLPEAEQSKVVGQGSLIMFLSSAGFPLLICPLLDQYSQSWRWIFPLLGLISLARLPFLFLLLKSYEKREEKQKATFSLSAPWIRGWRVLRSRPDFAYYQAIFFCGGLGLMIMQPSLPQIIEQNLQLSYTEIALAVAFCKGIGFAATVSLWSSKLHRTNIFKYCGIVTLFAACSICLILLSKFLGVCIYLAFFLYGVMQAGSQLSWQLGGPIFSPKQDSSHYTSINVIFVGLRGCIGPLLGGLLCARLGSTIALGIGGLFCALGCVLGFFGNKEVQLTPKPDF